MNISLINPEENLMEEITEHQDVMIGAGYAITGTAVLLPDDQAQYPGSYQVWSPFFDPESGSYLFVYVDPEGRAIQMDELPGPDFLSAS
jgi:hypothetical protein